MFLISPTKANCYSPRIAKGFVEAWSRHKIKEDIFDTPTGEIIVGISEGRRFVLYKSKKVSCDSHLEFKTVLAETLSLAFGDSNVCL